jgi:hypothetical protein
MDGCGFGDGVDSAACCGGRVTAACAAAGSGEPEAADFEDRSKASEGCAFGGSSYFGIGVSSAGETRSTVIGSAVTELNGFTSVKNSTSIKADR